LERGAVAGPAACRPHWLAVGAGSGGGASPGEAGAAGRGHVCACVRLGYVCAWVVCAPGLCVLYESGASAGFGAFVTQQVCGMGREKR